MRPWGGMEQLTFSPDSKTIVYTCRKKVGKEYAYSTNSDIYLYDIATKKTTNLSEGMMGYDQNPVFSSDGKLLAWESMERDGYEADKIRLMVMDLTTKEIKDYSKDFDQNSNGLTFSKDNKSIYFISDYQGKDDIYQLTLADNSFKKITNGIHDYTSVMIAKDKLIGTKMSMSQPVEIYSVNQVNGSETNISNINKDLLAKVKMGKIEERWFKATDGKDLHSWVIFPPDFDSTKKYPTILYCEGGPQSTVSQFWSYRWNFQIMASHGYIIVAPNRRGLPGFGQKWNEQISGDYGGQCMKDYLTAIDEMCKESYVDKDHLGSVGPHFFCFKVLLFQIKHSIVSDKAFETFVVMSSKPIN
jgi:dipeptidyl aminopeptidase/acylaminoacyl peptidase